MNRDESLKIHINPNNRRVSINDEEYIDAWTKALEEKREEIKAQLREKIKSGELEIPVIKNDPNIPVGLGDAMQSTPEDALHFRAHSLAEQAMQDWAVKRGIGMIGVTGGHDHGQLIEYVDDPSVPFLEYEVEKAA